jgi:hypothetical protein
MRIAELTHPVDLWDSKTVFKQVIQLRFLCHLWVLCIDWFEFYCDVSVILRVVAAEHLAKSS